MAEFRAIIRWPSGFISAVPTINFGWLKIWLLSWKKINLQIWSELQSERDRISQSFQFFIRLGILEMNHKKFDDEVFASIQFIESLIPAILCTNLEKMMTSYGFCIVLQSSEFLESFFVVFFEGSCRARRAKDRSEWTKFFAKNDTFHTPWAMSEV